MIEDVPRIFEAVFQCTLEVSFRTLLLCLLLFFRLVDCVVTLYVASSSILSHPNITPTSPLFKRHA